MRFGLQVNPHLPGATGNPWDGVAAVARAADETGYDSLFLYDHFLYEGGYSGHPYPEPVLECFVTLGAIAAITKRITLGQLVLGIPYRNPAMLTKMATSLDVISGGRTILGIGAGWHQRELEAYGWGELEEIGTRMKRFEEAIQVILKLWTERPASHDGRFYHLNKVIDNPAPIQWPHPPIMIGGSGEKVTLRLVAQYGQMCNVSGDAETVRNRVAILKDHCTRLGRPFEDITVTNHGWVIIGRDRAEVDAKVERLKDLIPRGAGVAGTPDELIEHFRAYAAAGSRYCTIQMPDWVDVEPVRLFAETVIPALAST
jgi:F420-dependent oxidoreductase-like protein